MLPISEITQQIIAILEDVLALRGTGQIHAGSRLLGSLPELDSMAVLNVIAALEDHFGVDMQDDDISAGTFESVATLSAFVERQLDE